MHIYIYMLFAKCEATILCNICFLLAGRRFHQLITNRYTSTCKHDVSTWQVELQSSSSSSPSTSSWSSASSSSSSSLSSSSSSSSSCFLRASAWHHHFRSLCFVPRSPRIVRKWYSWYAVNASCLACNWQGVQQQTDSKRIEHSNGFVSEPQILSSA